MPRGNQRSRRTDVHAVGLQDKNLVQLACRFDEADLRAMTRLAADRKTSTAAVVRDLVAIGLKTMRGDAK